MFSKPVNERGGGFHLGYSWCGGLCRWGTRQKIQALNNYIGDNIDYVGIAYDEPERIGKEARENKRFPLHELGITEAQALGKCYERGFFWEENGVRLYDILDRVSCYCCGNKNLKELKNMYLYLPEYWQILRELQSKTDRPFRRDGKTIFDLEERFSRGLPNS